MLFFENHLTNKAGFILLFLSAVSSAFAVSTKTNSWLLIYVLLLGQLLFCDRGRLVNWKETVTKTCLWFFLFVGTYIYLQPELWTSPTAGFVRFFSQRLAQQNQFVHSFGTVGFFEYHKWLVELSAQSNHVVITIIKVTVLLIALIKFIKIFLTNFSKTNFLIKQLIIVTPIWLFFFFSARIGFDRYAIWPIIILAIFSSWILTRKKLLI